MHDLRLPGMLSLVVGSQSTDYMGLNPMCAKIPTLTNRRELNAML